MSEIIQEIARIGNIEGIETYQHIGKYLHLWNNYKIWEPCKVPNAFIALPPFLLRIVNKDTDDSHTNYMILNWCEFEKSFYIEQETKIIFFKKSDKCKNRSIIDRAKVRENPWLRLYWKPIY